MPIQQELLKIEAASQLTGTPVKTLRRWIFERKIPYIKLPTGAIRFQVEELRRWYNAGRIAPLNPNAFNLGIETPRDQR